MFRSRRALKRSAHLEERVGRRPKKPKFLPGEHVYVQKVARGKKVILFGVINFDRETLVQRWNIQRRSVRVRRKYFVQFDEAVIQVIGRRKRQISAAWISEGSLHRFTNDEDVARKLLGEDYL